MTQTAKKQMTNILANTMRIIDERISYQIITHLLNDLNLDKRDIELYYLLLLGEEDSIFKAEGGSREKKREFYSQQEIIRYVRKNYGKGSESRETPYLRTSQNIIVETLSHLIDAGLIKKVAGENKRKATHKFQQFKPALVSIKFDSNPIWKTESDFMNAIKTRELFIKRTLDPSIHEHIVLLENFLYKNRFSLFNDETGEKFLAEIDKMSIQELDNTIRILFDYLGFQNNVIKFEVLENEYKLTDEDKKVLDKIPLEILEKVMEENKNVSQK